MGGNHRCLVALLVAAGCNDPASARVEVDRARPPLLWSGFYVADAEKTMTGTQVGSYLDTHQHDGVYETIEEKEQGAHQLKHRWQIQSVPGDAGYEIFVVAKRAAAAGDAFTFTYSASASTGSGTGRGASCGGERLPIGAGCVVDSAGDVACSGITTLGPGEWRVCIHVRDAGTGHGHDDDVDALLVDFVALQALCGNGRLDAGEQCDDGGSATGCCTDDCTFVAGGTPCGDGVCDQCDATGSCLPSPAGVGPGCDGAATACSGADSCDGSGECDANHFPAGTEGDCGTCSDCDGSGACGPVAAGAPDVGCDAPPTPCSAADTCDGAGVCDANHLPAGAEGACPICSDCDGSGACAPVAAGASDDGCDASSSGPCEIAATCTGGGACVGGGYAPAGTICRPAVDLCDAAELCTGASPGCPADAFAPAGTGCRGAAGPCDLTEACTGAGPACPSDAVAAAGTVCRGAAALCDRAESCDGVSVSCPADGVLPAGAVCRAADGRCDLAELCDGLGSSCPPDTLASSDTICRGAVRDCDAIEFCDGASAVCPADQAVPDRSPCRVGSQCMNGQCVK